MCGHYYLFDIDPSLSGWYEARRKIGMDMDEQGLIQQFDQCLLTDVEMAGGPEQWKLMVNPFPEWESLEQSSDN